MTQTVGGLRAVEKLIAGMSPEERRALEDKVAPVLSRRFIPNPGQQTLAYESKADFLLYGGAAGGGKSALLIGVATTEHHRSLILRREASEIDGLLAETRPLLANYGSYNGKDLEWSFDDGKSLKFGGMKEPEDWQKYAGRARDFIGFDEGAEFLEKQIASLAAWKRTTIQGQRTRIIFASNPPRSEEGAWVLKWFGPWLDNHHPLYLTPFGQIRWAVRFGDDIQFKWVEGPEPVMVDGREYRPESFTFIPAYLDDNPFLTENDDYRRTLQNLPTTLREQLEEGNFLAGRTDDEWQVIPSAWIALAHERWQADAYRRLQMTTMAADVAQGGIDNTIIASRYGTWFAPLIERKGVDTPDPQSVAGLIGVHRRHNAIVVVDVGGGYGGGVVAFLSENNIPSVAFNGSNKSMASTGDKQLKFFNKRAETYWRFREALDPSQEGGSPIALAPDPILDTELSAPRWKLTPRGILVEPKDDIKKRLGRSPDRADATVMCWSEGQIFAARRMGANNGRMPQVHRGYEKMKRRR